MLLIQAQKKTLFICKNRINYPDTLAATEISTVKTNCIRCSTFIKEPPLILIAQCYLNPAGETEKRASNILSVSDFPRFVISQQ